MNIRVQIVRWMVALSLCAGVSMPAAAQKNHPGGQVRAAHQQVKPPKPNPPRNNPNRPPANQARPKQQEQAQPRPNGGGGAGPNGGGNFKQTPRQQLGVGAPRPWMQRMREATPAQRERFFQNSPAFRNLPPERQQRLRESLNRWDRMNPQQKADQVEKERNWQSLSAEQKAHIKNDILPAWKQMSPARQDAIQHRLGILKNMPESARNERLNDPKFTEGMSEDDKAMLHDLSHMHIGGAPDPPTE
jgi:hypothetical protein